jgi:8-oxo-dGTP pyrophosphatase MutT (NUDIX family)
VLPARSARSNNSSVTALLVPAGTQVDSRNARRQKNDLRRTRHQGERGYGGFAERRPPAAGGYIYELPAGKLEPGEPPEETARRELVEEGAVSAARWESLGEYFSSPGVFTEVIHLFLATELTPVQARPEADEVFQVEWWPLEQAVERAASGELKDAKTIIGILRAASRKKIA